MSGMLLHGRVARIRWIIIRSSGTSSAQSRRLLLSADRVQTERQF